MDVAAGESPDGSGSASARRCTIIDLPPGQNVNVGPGVEVQMGAEAGRISSVGWRATGPGGTIDLTAPSAGGTAPVALPLDLGPWETARWRIDTAAPASIGPPDEVALRAFAVIDEARVDGASTFNAADQPRPSDLPVHRPGGWGHHLAERERRVTSQNGEDGVIAAIFDLIGTTDRRFVEFGCGNGTECNGAQLLEDGWTGLLMDPFETSANPLADIRPEFVTAENIDHLLRTYDIAEQFDLLSIDVDGNDYWIWKAIDHRPRVVIVEYNSHVSPKIARTIGYDANFRYPGTDYYGASLRALVDLGRQKGYTLVYCERHGVNSFFVADELLPAGLTVDPLEDLYRPLRWFGLEVAYPTDPHHRMVDPQNHELA